MMAASSRLAALAILLLVAGAACAASPRMSVWYRFESEASLGTSTGMDPWPAYPSDAACGEGRIGKGMVLPGHSGNGLYLPNPVSFFGPEAHAGTIALWVKPAFSPAAGAGQRVIVDFMRDTNNTLIDGYEIVIFTDGKKLKAKPSLIRQMEIESPLREGHWTHLALTWDDLRGTSLFVDGAKAAELPGVFEPTVLEPGWPGRVGCHTPSGAYPFAGTIDELRLFNYPLSAEDIADLVRLRPPATCVAVSGDWVRSVTIRNRSREAINDLRLQVCLPGRYAPPPFHGYLPFSFDQVSPETLMWIAGATPGETVTSGVKLAPRSTMTLAVPDLGRYLGPRRVRLMAGEGAGMVEVAGREFAGLDLQPTRYRPITFVAGRPFKLEVRATNDLGRSFDGAIRAQLVVAGRGVAAPRLPLRLAQGQTRRLVFDFPQAPAPGAHQIKLFAVEGFEDPVLVNQLALYTTQPVADGRRWDIAAAYVGPPNDPMLLGAMTRDGVAAVRLHGKYGDYYSSEKNMSALLEHGLQAWRMAAASYSAVCADPDRRERLRRYARNLGAYLRQQPAVINQTIAGEGLTYPPCYCEECTRAYRTWLQGRYRDLNALNATWGTDYRDWTEVPQLGSPMDIDQTAERLKRMRVALELPQENTARWRKLHDLNKPRGLDWKRWHEEVLVDWYRDFVTAFHATNQHETYLSEQPCWPNFESHILFALGRIADMGGMDLYLPGEGPTTLGYAAELFLNFDMNASIFHAYGKPIMVHELYVQDNSPALLPEAQGWWLLGRGYSLLTYFTYDYYHEGVRAGLPLIFGLFQKDGKPHACYDSFVRFSRELKEFHRRNDCATLRREEPRVALFMGDDISLVNNLETGGETWGAPGVHGHNGAYWLTERCGYPVEFVNDDLLTRLDRETVLIVPWCPVIRPKSLEAIFGFAVHGGTVILDGPPGLYDDRYQPYSPLPGGQFGLHLGVTLTGYEDKPNRIVAPDGTTIEAQGVPLGVEMKGGKVLCKDEAGRPAVVQIRVGYGQVVFFLPNLGRRHRHRAPDPKALALWGGVLAGAGLQPRCTFVPAARQAEPGATPDKEGPSLFDYALRIKNDRDLFIFMTSFFGPSEGTLLVDLPGGVYEVFDGVTGEPYPASESGGKGAIPVSLPAYGSRVVRISARQGPAFADW